LKKFLDGRDDLWLVEDWAEVSDRFLANALQALFERVTGRRGIGALRYSEAEGYAERMEEPIEAKPLGAHAHAAGRDQLYEDRVIT